jgi:hypothetical protein
MKVHDTALVNIQTAMKLKTDSIYTRLGSGVVVSSIPSATQTTLEDISLYTFETKQQLEIYLQALKLKTDSIYKRMYQDSINLAKLGTGVTTTLDSATQRGTIQVSGHDSTTDSRLGVKLLVNPTITNDSSTLSRTTIKVSNFPATQAVSGSVTATLDSATQRSTMKISNFPATQAVSGTFWQTTQPISGTITTSPPSNASSNISQINSTTPLMGNGVTGTGSQRVTIASDNTAFSVNTIPSATDSTKYRGTMQISNFPATQPVSLSGNVNTTISGVVKKTLGTQVVSTDTGLVVNAVMHGLSTGGGGGYFDVKVNPSGALTVDATQSGTWNVNNVSGTISLPTGASTESTSSAIYAEILDQSTNYLSPSKLKLDSIYTRLGTGVTVNSHPVTFTRLKSSTDTVAISGSITATAGATTIFDSTYTAVQMDTAGLGAKANSATVGWQSDSVGLRQHKCTDVKIGVKISMANTAPANDKAVYVYVYPMWYDGSTWYFTSGGTTTLPSGANSTYTIASPNNLRLLGVLSYTTTNMILQDQFVLSNAFGSTMPDAFGLVIVDFSGAAIHTTNHRIYYSLINKVQR